MGIESYIKGIKIESEYLPPVVIDDPFKAGPPNAVLSRLKPKITVTLKDGLGGPVTIAPYGEPGPNKWGTIKVIGGLVVGLLVVGSVYLVRR